MIRSNTELPSLSLMLANILAKGFLEWSKGHPRSRNASSMHAIRNNSHNGHFSVAATRSPAFPWCWMTFGGSVGPGRTTSGGRRHNPSVYASRRSVGFGSQYTSTAGFVPIPLSKASRKADISSILTDRPRTVLFGSQVQNRWRQRARY